MENSFFYYLFVFLFVLNGIFLSFYLEKTSFCMLGMISDFLIFKGTKRLKQWLIIIVVGILLLQCGLAFINFISSFILNKSSLNFSQPQFIVNQWNYLAKNAGISGNVIISIIGGFVFGMGMTLASGCGLKQIQRLGQFNEHFLITVLTLCSLSFGALLAKKEQFREIISGFQNDIFSFFSVPIIDYVTVSPSLIAKHIFFNPIFHYIIVFLLIITLYLIVLVLFLTYKQLYKQLSIERLLITIRNDLRLYKYLANLASKEIKNTVILSFLFVIFILLMFASHYFNLLGTFSQNSKQPKIEGLSFVMPIHLWFDYLWGKSMIISGSMWGIIGLLLGQFIHSYSVKRLSHQFNSFMNFRNFTNFKNFVKGIIGGLMMGIGGVIAMGCTIGQGVSALIMLAPSGLFVVFGLFLGVKVILSFS
jgi:uncharacterized membrane protein YedE/YeeE